MPIDPGAVGLTSEPLEARWTSADALLYALSVGAAAADPTDPTELCFTTENSVGVTQKVLPTFALAVTPGASPLSRVGTFDPKMMVNAGQALSLHAPIPVEGRVEARTRIIGIWDKGSGALVEIESAAKDLQSGRELWTATTGVFIRGEGGWGGPRGAPADKVAPRSGDPDHVVRHATRPDQALLYRLTGDRTPIHSDPLIARRAGFERPILHGRCTLGFAGRAVLHALCSSNPDRFKGISGRFVAPVVPGDELVTSVWVIGDGQASFEVTRGDGAPVLSAGVFEFDPPR